ncbi:MAG: hypothetical protein JWN86_515 [Planctomycetota bacterium]|nr:hypothetical protein [Planctomycetota bacterium]
MGSSSCRLGRVGLITRQFCPRIPTEQTDLRGAGPLILLRRTRPACESNEAEVGEFLNL